MTTWNELKKSLDISPEDLSSIRLEEDLIRAMIAARKEKGLSQARLAEACDVKQPMIARIESFASSPQVDTMLKILSSIGYTLRVVPIKSGKE